MTDRTMPEWRTVWVLEIGGSIFSSGTFFVLQQQWRHAEDGDFMRPTDEHRLMELEDMVDQDI